MSIISLTPTPWSSLVFKIATFLLVVKILKLLLKLNVSNTSAPVVSNKLELLMKKFSTVLKEPEISLTMTLFLEIVVSRTSA